METEIKYIDNLCVRITDGSHFSPEDDEKGLYPMYSVKDMEYNSVEECYIVNLDQYDTLLFHKVGIPTPVKESLITIQFKFLTKDDDVWVSKPVQDRLYDVIHSEVLR